MASQPFHLAIVSDSNSILHNQNGGKHANVYCIDYVVQSGFWKSIVAIA